MPEVTFAVFSSSLSQLLVFGNSIMTGLNFCHKDHDIMKICQRKFSREKKLSINTTNFKPRRSYFKEKLKWIYEEDGISSLAIQRKSLIVTGGLPKRQTLD